MKEISITKLIIHRQNALPRCLRYYEQQNRIYILNKQLTYRSNLSESHSPSQEMNCGGSRDAVERLTTGKKKTLCCLHDVLCWHFYIVAVRISALAPVHVSRRTLHRLRSVRFRLACQVDVWGRENTRVREGRVTVSRTGTGPRQNMSWTESVKS